MKLNRSKCHLKKPEIQLLCPIVNKDGVKLDLVKPITLQHLPTNSNELQTFLGLAAYIEQKVVPKFTNLITPLWERVRALDFKWDVSMETAFNDVKLIILTIQSLIFL